MSWVYHLKSHHSASGDGSELGVSFKISPLPGETATKISFSNGYCAFNPL